MVSRITFFFKKRYPRRRVTLDFDSSVIGVSGSQQGAEKGFNPKKKGQKSYHPLLCFVAETRECLHSWFRTGSAYTGNGAPDFIRECFSRIPKRVWKIFVRADSGFFNGALLEVLEEKNTEYLIKVKMKNLASLLIKNGKKLKVKKEWKVQHLVINVMVGKRNVNLLLLEKSLIQQQVSRLFFRFQNMNFFAM